MNIYNLAPNSMPNDAEYYFNILVINIMVRESLQADKKEIVSDIWDISHITDSRPYVIHLYIELDEYFEEDENWAVELYPNKAVEVSPTLGISFYDIFDEDDEEFEGDIEIEDLWRL